MRGFSEENVPAFLQRADPAALSRKIAMILRRFAAARTAVSTPNIFSTRSTKCAGKIFCAGVQAIAAIFRGDFAQQFCAEKKSPRIC